MAAHTPTQVHEKLRNVDQIPSIPAVVMPLLRYLDQPVDRLEMQKVVDLISQDKSLAAQVLHIANSPLFGRYQAVDSVRGAVVALGLRRMRDITMSCSMLNLVPADVCGLDPVTLWEHSLACALVCRRFAQKIGSGDAEKAYLAGLLHDLGILVNMWLLPKEFACVVGEARSRQIALLQAEQEVLGVTHCDTGQLVADRWQLGADISQVIRHHHAAENSDSYRSLVALVNLSDLLCRVSDLGYGHIEACEVNFLEQRAFQVLLQDCPSLEQFDWARFTFELEDYVVEVRNLVRTLYRMR
jgi:HD-like signal output (HDOD) protein